MPLTLNISQSDCFVKVWKIEEEFDFFYQNTTLTKELEAELLEIKNDNRKLEWMATRFLIQQFVNLQHVSKNDNGRPFLTLPEGHISVSHCKGYTACIFSHSNPVGIDIEPIHPKIERVAFRFLSEVELKFVSVEQRMEHLIALWAVKEAVYKFAGQTGIEFRDQIMVERFLPENNTKINAQLMANHKLYKTNLRLIHVENCILAYTSNI
jgi:4'-phosphopantetheinyl transferase